jgi:excisionase family DNA binding protein
MFSCTVVIGKDNVFLLHIKEVVMALGDEWPDLLTVREVAKILRVSPLTIKRWGKRGKLPAIRINSRGDRRYKKEAVLWLLGQQQKGAI